LVSSDNPLMVKQCFGKQTLSISKHGTGI